MSGSFLIKSLLLSLLKSFIHLLAFHFSSIEETGSFSVCLVNYYCFEAHLFGNHNVKMCVGVKYS